MAGVAASGMALFEIVRQALAATNNPNLVPSLILLGATVAPASFVTFIAGRRLIFELTPLAVILVAFVGGVVGVAAAGLVEYRTLQHLDTLPTITVAVIEETAKLAAPVFVLAWLPRRRHPANGLLIGVAAGAGFAVMETLG